MNDIKLMTRENVEGYQKELLLGSVNKFFNESNNIFSTEQVNRIVINAPTISTCNGRTWVGLEVHNISVQLLKFLQVFLKEVLRDSTLNISVVDGPKNGDLAPYQKVVAKIEMMQPYWLYQLTDIPKDELLSWCKNVSEYVKRR